MVSSDIENMTSLSREEKVMLDSAIGLISRFINASLPTTMNFALMIIFEDENPLVVHDGRVNRAMICQELRLAADLMDPPLIKKDKK